MDISSYRRAYFACCKALGLDDDTRHAFNYAMTGKYSTGDFSVEDWRVVLAELQRRTGANVTPGRPHVRGDRGGTPGGMITPAQLEFLTGLAAQITWTASPEAFIRGRLLSPARKAIWRGDFETLFRSEAAGAITAFKALAESEKEKANAAPVHG